MTPADLIARVRQALGRRAGDVVAPPPPVDPAWRRFVAEAHRDDLVARFSAAARALGVEVVTVAPEVLEQAVAAILTAAGATRVAYSDDCGLARASEGLPDTIEAAFDLDAGVTGVEAVIARSGTLALASGPGRPGMVSLAPPLHIAIVRPGQPGQVRGALADYFAALPVGGPSARVLVTGPSKTADIEGILITGVHGPGRVVVVILDER